MGNIYRVLDEDELEQYKINNLILCNGDFENIFLARNFHQPLNHELDSVISHLFKGNTTTSSWISCSKNFITDLEKYSVSKVDYPKNYRPSVAVIRNHDQNSLLLDYYQEDVFQMMQKCNSEQLFVVKEFIRKNSTSHIKKMVIDTTDLSFLSKLFTSGIIQTKNGKIPSMNCSAINYAKSDEEVLILNKVEDQVRNPNYKFLSPSTDIPFILKPLVYDIFYSLIQNGDISDTPADILFFKINHYLENFLDTSCFTPLEKSVYLEHYLCNYPLETIIDCYDDSRLDILSFYDRLKGIKRSIISKITTQIGKYYGISVSSFSPLIEDTRFVARSEGNFENIDVKLLNGQILPNVVPLTNEKYSFSEFSLKDFGLIYQYGESDEFYTLNNGQKTHIYMESNQVKKYSKIRKNR